MKDEIKEILEDIKEHSNNKYINPLELIDAECKLLLDYITNLQETKTNMEHELQELYLIKDNLQEKVEQYENPDDMTLFYMWLDEKAKDKMKKLQEENKRQEELISRLYSIIDDDKENFKLLEQENEKLKEDNYELQKYINEEEGFVKDKNRELGLRIDKAVEYNDKNIHSQTLNNILEGSDDNE